MSSITKLTPEIPYNSCNCLGLSDSESAWYYIRSAVSLEVIGYILAGFVQAFKKKFFYFHFFNQSIVDSQYRVSFKC